MFMQFPKEYRTLSSVPAQGLKAIHSPHTGIIDWGLVTKHYGQQFEKQGGHVYTSFPVSALQTTPEGKAGSQDGLKYPVTVVGDSSKVC